MHLLRARGADWAVLCAVLPDPSLRDTFKSRSPGGELAPPYKMRSAGKGNGPVCTNTASQRWPPAQLEWWAAKAVSFASCVSQLPRGSMSSGIAPSVL